MATLDDTADYIITSLADAGTSLNLLKLQKLVYYAQAWHLALYNRPLFGGKFQAWVHGPVSRALYDRFADTKSLYSAVAQQDVRPGFDQASLTSPERAHLEAVLEVYAPLTGDQLEALTHSEDPWTIARGDCAPTQRSEQEIDESVMQEYYARLANAN